MLSVSRALTGPKDARGQNKRGAGWKREAGIVMAETGWQGRRIYSRQVELFK